MNLKTSVVTTVACLAIALSSTAFAADKYSVVVTPPASVTKGQQAVVLVHIQGAGGYGVNTDYPTKLVIVAPAGVKVVKPTMLSADAKTFTRAGADFEIQFVSSEAGTKAFTGELKFAVSTETDVFPVTHKLSFSVTVK